ncbi:xanthine dehydrogenase family protein subunit M [uncultured Croceicoccus sp.]|uniref:FAD binding domain-containing protein n=1 Tax=uncultured Croceicoccus sp. TaxID=1295329 RepID=UPI00263792F6|nr:xanthine dehydrogenase family protein subunit M [uncultured Croceicoccus sp.]
MRPFEYQRCDTVTDARQAGAGGSRFIAGGTNLLDLMKLQIETPQDLADINRIGLDTIDETDEGGLRIGALVRNSDCAADARILRDYPVLARAILAGASGQLRNRATTGGNLCQRTRCSYFYDTAMPCNKREPGTGCGARGGQNRNMAVLGTSEHCIATYPGDMAVAMYALDATVEIQAADGGTRLLPVRQFHRLPGDTPERDNELDEGELITAVLLPKPVGGKHGYRKARDRASYAFALVSLASVVEVSDGKIARADLAFGSLGTRPWHDPRLEQLLVGEEPSKALFEKAADTLLAEAKGFGGNDFKIPLARRMLIATLADATGLNAAGEPA